MVASNVRSPRLLAAALTALLVVAGCTGSAAAPVSPSASPTVPPDAASMAGVGLAGARVGVG